MRVLADDWFTWSVVLVIGDRFIYDIGSTQGGKAVGYPEANSKAASNMAEHVFFDFTAFDTAEMLTQAKVITEKQSIVDLVVAYQCEQLMVTDQPDILKAINTHRTMLGSRQDGPQPCTGSGTYNSMLQKIIDEEGKGSDEEQKRLALSFIYLVGVAGWEAGQFTPVSKRVVQPQPTTLDLLMKAAVVMSAPTALSYVLGKVKTGRRDKKSQLEEISMAHWLGENLCLLIAKAMRNSQISWLRALPGLNLIEKEAGHKVFTAIPPLQEGDVRKPDEAAYRTELRVISDRGLINVDYSVNSLLVKRRWPLGYWAGVAHPGSLDSAMALLQIEGDKAAADEHVTGALDSLCQSQSRAFHAAVLSNETFLSELLTEMERQNRHQTCQVSLERLFAAVASSVRDHHTATNFIARISALHESVNLCGAAMSMMRNNQFASVDLPTLTGLLVKIYSAYTSNLLGQLDGTYGAALGREDYYNHGGLIRRFIEEKLRSGSMSHVLMLRTISIFITHVSWTQDYLIRMLEATLGRQLDIEQVQHLLQVLPFEGIHDDVRQAVWDQCTTLLEPEDPGLHNYALDGFAAVVKRWTHGGADGVVLRVIARTFDVDMECESNDSRYIEVGEFVTVTVEEFSSTANMETWTGVVRGVQTTMLRSNLQMADDEQYEGRKNVQGALTILGNLAQRVLPFLVKADDDILVEELLSSDSALKLSALHQDLMKSDTFGESRKSKAFFDAMTRLNMLIEARAKSLQDRTITSRDLQIMLSEQFRDRALDLFGNATATAGGGSGFAVADVFASVEMALAQANESRELMASLHRFLDSLRSNLDFHLRRHLEVFERLQRNWAETKLCDLDSSDTLAIAQPNRDVMTQLKTMQQSATLFPVLKRHLVECVVQQWGTPAGAHNLDVFVGKVDSEYVKDENLGADAGDWFRVALPTQVRESIELDSATCGQLQVSEVLKIEEEGTTQGIRRLRTRYGWTSAVSSDGTVLVNELERVVAQNTGQMFNLKDGKSLVGIVAPGSVYVLLESEPGWKDLPNRVYIQSVSSATTGWVEPSCLTDQAATKPGRMMAGLVNAVTGARKPTPEELNMTEDFKARGEIQQTDVFTWMLPQMVASWHRLYTQLFSLTIALPRIDDVLGKVLVRANKAAALLHELNVLSETGDADSQQGQIAEAATVVQFIARYSRVAHSKRFLWSVLGLVENLKIQTTGDEEFAACKTAEMELRSGWQTGTLKDADALQEKIEAFLVGLSDIQRDFLQIVANSSKIISIILTGLASEQFVYLKDSETMRAMQQRVLDNQDFSVIETDAVTQLSNIRDKLTAVLGPHTSFHNFMDAMRRLKLMPEHINLLKKLEPTVMSVERVFKSLNVRVGAKDSALLENILATATWRFTQPLSVRGEPEALARDTVVVEVDGKVMTLLEATGLRDRLYLEVDENATDEASIQAKKNMDEFHGSVEAIREYNVILVRLYLKGHRETGNTYIKEIDAGTSVRQILEMRDRCTNSLKKWEKGVSDLRDQCPAMNYFTVHQLMIIGESLRDNTVPYHMLRFARPIEEGSISDEMVQQNFTKMLPGGSTTGSNELMKQYSVVSLTGLRLLEAVGTFLAAAFALRGSAFRRIAASAGLEELAAVEINKSEVNLVTAPSPNHSLATLLAMYAQLGRVPLAAECLFCTPTTSLEEVILLIRRCFDAAKNEKEHGALNADGSDEHLRLTLVNADMLPHALQQEIIAILNRKIGTVIDPSFEFDLIILCGENRCLFADSYRSKERIVSPLDPEDEARLVASVFPSKWSAIQTQPFVKVFTADKVGVGKSFQLMREAKESYADLGLSGFAVTSVPLSNQSESADAILPYLRADTSGSAHAYHINVAATCSTTCDYLMFQLVVCGDMVDKYGVHYSPSLKDAFYIELPSELNLATAGVLLTDMLQFCMSLPKRHITLMTDPLVSNIPNDENSDVVQLVAKYLHAFDAGWLSGNSPRGDFLASKHGRLSPAEVDTALRAHAPEVSVYDETAENDVSMSSVMDVSMILTMTFVRFLHSMLHVIDTVFMADWGGMLGNESIKAMGKPDFKERLIRSLIQTSKEYAGRTISPHSLLPEQAKAMGLIVEKDKGKTFGLMDAWNARPMILPTPLSTYELLCLDPTKVPKDISDYWSTGFQGISGFKFQDYRNVTKTDAQGLLQRLSGVRAPGPDVETKFSSFVLTIDNILKMVAVYFRAEAGISVVIMGETGCGKTFSISYLSAFLSIPFFKLDVHGGIGEEDVKEFMVPAIEECATNQRVWVFLDEVNTCDALGLFKEMICDHTMDGKPLPKNLTVLAACNPYRIRPPSMGRTG